MKRLIALLILVGGSYAAYIAWKQKTENSETSSSSI
jgi:hypothetical protein